MNFFTFPGADYRNGWVLISGGEELASTLGSMPWHRPEGIERDCTYPCVVTNPLVQGGPRVKIEPLIGTADQGLYLRQSDIKKLRLEYTGRDVVTRNGICKVYSGARLRIPNDLNGGKVTYTTQTVYELPHAVSKGVRANHASNYRKYGIIGIPLLATHAVYFNHLRVHIIDISVIATSPTLRPLFQHMVPLSCVCQRHRPDPRTRQVSIEYEITNKFPPGGLAVALELASRYSPPPFNAFDVTEPGTPILRLAEACRACGNAEDSGVKLSNCTRCIQEKRPRRALYCSRECLDADWKRRHKAEHTGEREWAEDSEIPRFLYIKDD
ncbi:hypothetical protein LXA43DRAFT_883142 [Ganoderma leucocontextum]|nr:hypothetical protein LXA43DRAFT_883142 [Ganoderma leucocontextum]